MSTMDETMSEGDNGRGFVATGGVWAMAIVGSSVFIAIVIVIVALLRKPSPPEELPSRFGSSCARVYPYPPEETIQIDIEPSQSAVPA